MATVSARIDDQLKADAERVADSIGLSLSSAINIFLKRFAADGGFPFPVTAVEEKPSAALRDVSALEMQIRQALADPENPGRPHHFSYYDENTGRIITTITKKHQ